jgi:peptidylprolyl isomerase
MAEAGKPNDEGFDRAKLKRFLVPAGAVAAVVVLVGLVMSVSGAMSRKMSDGSDGTAGDPGLKEIAPGVRYRDLKVGTGDPCPPDAQVTMHYTGWLENGEVFDSTREGKSSPAPFQASLKPGAGGLIPGWVEGVPGMKVGGVRKLVLAPEKAYGEKGAGRIPGNATLIFEIEMLGFAPPPQSSVRARRSPPPSDLTKLIDGTVPEAKDDELKPLGTDGLLYRDIKVGDGPECPNGAAVVMDYTGWLVRGGRPFDSSWNPGRQPLNMSLHSLIKGWQQGVPGMKVGGIRKLVIPPSLGYGSQDKGDIPPNSTLVFEIELLGFR